jgi:hypothetical protein
VEAQRALGLPHQKRIAVARVWPTWETSWPDGLGDACGHPLVGHTFFNKNKADIRPQPYSWPLVDRQPGLFREMLLDFVGSIRECLQKLKQELDQRRERDAERQRLARFSHGI